MVLYSLWVCFVSFLQVLVSGSVDQSIAFWSVDKDVPLKEIPRKLHEPWGGARFIALRWHVFVSTFSVHFFLFFRIPSLFAFAYFLV